MGYRTAKICIPEVTGNIVITAESEPNYINLADPSDSNWQSNTPASNYVTTNYINYIAEDVIRVKGLGSLLDYDTPYYNNSGTLIGSGNLQTMALNDNIIEKFTYNPYTDMAIITIADNASNGSFRFIGIPTGTADDVIITINERFADLSETDNILYIENLSILKDGNVSSSSGMVRTGYIGQVAIYTIAVDSTTTLYFKGLKNDGIIITTFHTYPTEGVNVSAASKQVNGQHSIGMGTQYDDSNSVFGHFNFLADGTITWKWDTNTTSTIKYIRISGKYLGTEPKLFISREP